MADMIFNPYNPTYSHRDMELVRKSSMGIPFSCSHPEASVRILYTDSYDVEVDTKSAVLDILRSKILHLSWYSNGAYVSQMTYKIKPFTNRQLNTIFNLGLSDQDLVLMKISGQEFTSGQCSRSMLVGDYIGDTFSFIVNE